MSVLNQSGEEQVECPLCMEPLEVDDLNFFPCTCGYQICRFCWHRIRTDENGLCPACRKAYPENPADFKPLSQEEVAKLKAEKRHKDQQRKQRITENRKHLANVRVVQRNLVFVVGLPMRLADSEVLKKHEYFGKFGKIHKVVINQSTSYAGSQGPSASAYVTYHKADDALRAIQAVNNIVVDGRTVKTSLGTTKYCSHFMKNQTCPKPDCMYLHDLGDAEASFTKEEMQQGKHQEYEKKLHDQLVNSYNHGSSRESSSGTNPSPSTVQAGQPCSKEAWPSLHPGIQPSSGNSNGASTSSSLSGSSSSNSSSNNNNYHTSSTKGEGNQRRQKFDHSAVSKNSSLTHKKRHNSGEDHRGKSKEKLHNSTMEDHLNKVMHNKMNVSHNQHINTKSPKELEVQKLPILTRSQTHLTTLSDYLSGDDIQTEITGIDVETHDADNGIVSVGGSVASATKMVRVLPSNHRAATLFEPDNNSFFSTNNFTKVAATAAGSAGTDWPGLTLTHMPDVLPPVHSSEDWQAAFGFANSTNPLQQGNSSPNPPQVATDNTTATGFSTSKDSERCDPVAPFESRSEISVQDFSSHSSSMENIASNIVQNPTEDFRVVNDVGHINDKIGNFTLEDMTVTATSSTVMSASSGHVYAHPPPAAFVQEPTVFMHLPHVMHNGVPGKFLSDFHLRQHNSPVPPPLQIHTNEVLDDTNYGRHVVEGGRLVSLGNFVGSVDSVLTSVKNRRNVTKLPNGTDVDLAESDENCTATDDEKYSNYGSLERQKSGGGENSSDDYLDFDHDSEIGEDNEEVGNKENPRPTDDDLGFDPFHETQKALAEMMEKENMMLMLQGQQNHVPHANPQVNHLNHLQYQHMNHINHHPGSAGTHPVFGTSKVLGGYSGPGHAPHPLLGQQSSHRLQHKLVDGLSSAPVPPRTRLPPPGFSSAPNHMNAFGLGIPRAPSNTGSKILPFMGLGNSPNSSNNGTSSPIPQQLNSIPNNIAHTSTNPPSILFPPSNGGHGNTTNHLSSTYNLQNGSHISNPAILKPTSDGFNMKEWPENLRSLLPNLNTGNNGGSPSPTPPPSSGPAHPVMQTNMPKTWSGAGPCSDWTALDPAIMSSSRPHNFLASTTAQHPIIVHNSMLNQTTTNSQYLHIQTTTHWLRSLTGDSCILYGGQNVANSSEWNHGSTSSNSMAPPPPPGFTLRMTPTQQTSTSVQNKSSVSQEITKIENL